MFRTLIAALALVVAATLPAAANEKRVALIVGIGDYQHLSSLDNPVPDAKAVAATLKAHGFDVSEHYNLTRADLLDALERFKREAEGAEVALVYYAGHGMEVDGKNVVAPTDMEIECANKTTIRSVALEQLFAAAGPAPQQIVLLDACRNNPFPQCPTRGANSGGGFRGFSRLSDEDRSLLIANATLSGQLAADGEVGDHSPFAKSLLKNFDAHPRLFLRDVLELTAKDVRVASRGVQVPEITTRGGSPKVCLDDAGCGEPVLSLPAESALNDQGALSEARAILQQLGFMTNKSRGGSAAADATLEDAVKRFQTKAGLTPDGEITPSLLAVLRATKTQVAALPVTPKPVAPGITSGPLEHDVGSTFTDCEGCPDMVVVPAGRFLMGAAKSEKGRQAAEEPQHEVTVASPFAISKFEITFDDFESCALEGGCNNYRPQDGGWGRGRRPVIYVSYDDARSYLDWLRQKSGKAYRLLSEAEWEFAARGGTSTPFAAGEKLAPTQANFDASSDAPNRKRGSYEGKTVEVGSFPPNPYGLHDMEGNVFEWVEDCWNPSHAGAPDDASPRGGDCKRRVVKGGAWYYEAEFARPSARMSFPKGSRLNVIGFRVARPLE
jgi:formylglycine-generating enzyme required for sulfatase activity